MRIPVSSSLLRRTAVAVGVVVIGLATVAPSQALASAHPDKKSSINTYSAWDGSSNVQSFGCPNTTTYGQVVTAPAKVKSLKKYSFYLNDFAIPGSMVVRGEVYAWNGTTATGSALSETAPRTLSYGDSAFHTETFKTGGAAVKAGSQYVIFLSIDKDFESCTNPYTNGWASVADTTYTGGTFVYQNNGGDESQWAGGAWNTFGIDLAFRANFK